MVLVDKNEEEVDYMQVLDDSLMQLIEERYNEVGDRPLFQQVYFKVYTKLLRIRVWMMY